MSTLSPVQHFLHNQGKQRFVVVDDPRLPFVRPLLEHFGTNYDAERNRAYFLRNDRREKEQFAAVTSAIDSLPKIELDADATQYAADALRNVPGVALSRQPVNLRRRDGATRWMAMAIDEPTRRHAAEVIGDALRIGPRDRLEIDMALYRATDTQRERFKEALRENFGVSYPNGLANVSRLEIDPHLALIQPPSRFATEQVVTNVKNGHLTSRNVDEPHWHKAVAAFERQGTMAPLHQVLKESASADVAPLMEKIRTLATPRQRSTIERLMEQNGGSSFGVEQVEGDLDLLKRWEAKVYIDRAKGDFDDTVSEEEDLERTRQGWGQEFSEEHSRQYYQENPHLQAPRRLLQGANGARNTREGSEELLERCVERLSGEGAKRIEIDGRVGALCIETATAHHLVGKVSDNEFVVLERDEFYYAPELKDAVHETSVADMLEGTNPLQGTIVTVSRKGPSQLRPQLARSSYATLDEAACEALAIANASILKRNVDVVPQPEAASDGIYLGGRGDHGAILCGNRLSVVPAQSIDHANADRNGKPLGLLEPITFRPTTASPDSRALVPEISQKKKPTVVHR
jgi:hypothetical protein